MNAEQIVSRRSLVALVVAGISAAVFWAGYGQPNQEAYLFPIIIGGIMLLAALVLLVREVFAFGNDDFKRFNFARQLPALVIATVGILTIETVGMYSTMFVVLFAITYWYSEDRSINRKLMHSLLFSIGFSVVIYLLFSVMLNVQLPRGFIL